MSDHEKNAPDFDRILDGLIDDLMGLTDAELIAELDADGVDRAAEAELAQSAIAEGVARAGRARLEAAREELRLSRKPRIVATPVPRHRRLEVLTRFAQDDPKLALRLTIAARNGQGISETELDSILADLRELGAIDENGDPK